MDLRKLLSTQGIVYDVKGSLNRSSVDKRL